MIAIRKGIEQDLPAALELVRELAKYEKEPEAVTADLEDYRKSLADGDFEFMVAEAEGRVIGLVLYYMCFSTWKGKMMYLEDFIVTRDWRGRGVGSLLYQAFMDESRRQRARLSKWQVLDWNEPALSFYRKQNAIIESEWLNCKVFHPNN